jgi:hypothetical protein
MNAGGVSKACKSNGLLKLALKVSGKRESNTLVTYPQDGNNTEKFVLIPDMLS